jgi:hypothetical protein
MRTIKVFTTIEVSNDPSNDAHIGYALWLKAKDWGEPQLLEVFEGTERTYALKP